MNFFQLKAIDAGVVSVLQQLWPWCTAEKTICLAVLEALCTLTARCPQGTQTSNSINSCPFQICLKPLVNGSNMLD